jgi:signal transduction histidine kinase
VKLKISTFLLVFGISVILINNHLLDWNSITYKKVERELNLLIKNQRLDLVNWQKDPNPSSLYRKRFICEGEVFKWSDDRAFPSLLSYPELGVIESENGIFIIHSIKEESCMLVSAVPIIHYYSISNKYLSNSKSSILHPSIARISLDSGDHHFNDLFYYTLEITPNRIVDAFGALCCLLAILLILHSYTTKSLKSFLISLIILIIARYISLHQALLPNFIRYPFFDDIHYYSSFINPTIGDLLVNTLLFAVIGLAVKHLTTFESSRVQRHIFYGVAVFAAVQLYFVTVSIVDNSLISLDIGQSITFTSLRVIGYFTILIIGVLSTVLAVHTLRLILHHREYITAGLLFTSLTLLLYLFDPKAAWTGIGLVLFVAFFVFISLLRSESLHDDLLIYFTTYGLIVSFILTFYIYQLHEKEELESKKKFANYLLIKRDVLDEFYLNEILESLVDNPSDSIPIQQQIERALRSSYLSKYELSFTNTPAPEGYKLSKTEYERIFFIENEGAYGYTYDLDSIALRLDFKRTAASTVFPELLTDEKLIRSSDKFDYAVFKDEHIIFQRSQFGSGELLESDEFANEMLFSEGIEEKGKHFFGVRTSDGRVILIISSIYSNRSLISNFSFFLLLFLLAYSLNFILYNSSFSPKRYGLTTKLQFYVGLSFVISMVVTGFALLGSLNNSYKQEIERNYLKKTQHVSEIIADRFSRNTLNRDILQVGETVNEDVSFYNKAGLLQATSQPEIFNLNLQSNLVNPIVYQELIEKKNQSIITDESIGKLDYKVCYSQVKNQNDYLIGFIAIPFFNSKSHVNRQQVEVFGSILSVFGIIFTLAILIGNTVLNNLLLPLRMVADKIRKVTLQDTNEPINYESDDEIGLLVRDYNQMLIKLEKSKVALANTQKELAWKGIAKQVAHEIKNPLTPMKLKIQQLMKHFQSGTKEHEILSALMNQIETLSQIAESFSAFAEMPAPDNAVIDFSKMVRSSLNLYRSEDCVIQAEIEDNIEIFADKEIWRRILNNLVLNAIQSVENKQADINVSLSSSNQKAVLSISDNGKGIPEELKDKIFINYFSTKSTGSGIGLALAKKGIENAGGNIWFESKEGEGTTFFVTVPLYRSGE